MLLIVMLLLLTGLTCAMSTERLAKALTEAAWMFHILLSAILYRMLWCADDRAGGDFRAIADLALFPRYFRNGRSVGRYTSPLATVV